MKIHAIQTGSVAITTAWREGVGHGRRRLVHTILDRSWTEPLPIYAFAIEHPEGVIVVDTGESARASQPGYFPRWHPVFRLAVREFVEPEQEIGPQLEQLGIEPGDVRQVVMTHLHTDHAGGLHHFPDTEVLAARAEIAYATGLRGQLRGYPNTRWPAWFDPTPVDLEPEPFGGFPQSLRLTKAGDVTLVPVPGHSPGQLGVLVEDRDHTVFLAGEVPTRRICCSVERSTALAPTRMRNASRTSESAPTPVRNPPSTWSRTTPTPPFGSPSGA